MAIITLSKVDIRAAPVAILAVFLSLMLSFPVFARSVTVQLLGADGNPVPGVVVYLDWLDASFAVEQGYASIEILQKNKGFAPYVSVVQSGARIRFANLDDITHHIYSVTGSKRFSYTIRAGEQTPELVLEKSGLVAMGCNMHDWMNGYVLILDTPYFAFTDDRGLVEFEVDEDGRFGVAAWHPRLNEEPRVEMGVRQSGLVELKLRRELKEMPRQKGVDDFDFLEGY